MKPWPPSVSLAERTVPHPSNTRCKWQNSPAGWPGTRFTATDGDSEALESSPISGWSGGDVERPARDVKEAVGGLVRFGELDGRSSCRSEEEAKEALVRYRSGCATPATSGSSPKRGHDSYLNQMLLVPTPSGFGLIDNKTCSIDETAPASARGAAGAAQADVGLARVPPLGRGAARRQSRDGRRPPTPLPLRPSTDERERALRSLRDRSHAARARARGLYSRADRQLARAARGQARSTREGEVSIDMRPSSDRPAANAEHARARRSMAAGAAGWGVATISRLSRRGGAPVQRRTRR